MTTDTPQPKLFISYSWTTPRHEQWVMDLAERLAADDVDVVIDKWALREGHDAHAFMEQMVTNPEIGKVAMICDVAYVEKANKRASGVGTETQIITGEIYNNTTQDKFVAVIAEKDARNSSVYFRLGTDFIAFSTRLIINRMASVFPGPDQTAPNDIQPAQTVRNAHGWQRSIR